jgi:hypothetical protein
MMVGKPNKTQATEASVEAFVDKVEPEGRRADAQALLTLMGRITGQPARMWGPSIIGFGVRRYRYESGREGEICKIGFSPRKPATVLYLAGQAADDPAVAALGKVTTGKGCIYVKSLRDVDPARLETIIEQAWRR